ncbi:MAG: tRNA lysidine(34) synthetase TilS [Betaproteobacteria bacterium]|nr:tRNA lysidine(34) synthetase TilS [Betaproteobacteria bacterium]
MEGTGPAARVAAFLREQRDRRERRVVQGAQGAWQLCVGFSGGLDSTVLLHCLAGLRAPLGLELTALHVHHGLQSEADAWAEHCAAVCADLAVPLAIERVRVVTTDKGIEAAARDARRRVFAAQPAAAILLAQHRDDQAETFLFRLLRGAGTRGLAAMRPVTPITQGPDLWRPLLDTPRAEILGYAKDNALRWVDDPSNADAAYTRNFLRLNIVPALATRFPAVGAILARTAEQMAEDAALLDELAELDFEGACDAEGGLSCLRLMALTPARARNLLRGWLARSGVFIDRARLDDLLKQALSAPDAHPEIRIGERYLKRSRGFLRWA